MGGSYGTYGEKTSAYRRLVGKYDDREYPEDQV